MALKLSNNAVGFLAATLAATDTTLALQPGQGALFPALSNGDWFPGTLIGSSGTIEIVRVTARTNDSMTVARAQENTAAQQFTAGSRFEHRLTAGALASIEADVQARLPTAGGEISGDLTVDGALNAATLKRGGNAVWDAGNFNPALYAPLAGATFTGKFGSAGISGKMGADDTACAEIRSTGVDKTDNDMAMLGFFCPGYYGIKIGLRGDGYFGIGGWSRAAWSWYTDTNGNMYSAGNVTAYSDPRLKDGVERIAGALALIEKLDGVRFTWNDRTKLIGRPGARDIGVLADQVEAVLPEIVSLSMPDESNGGERWRTVAYDKLIPVLIEGIKELAAEVRMQRRGL